MPNTQYPCVFAVGLVWKAHGYCVTEGGVFFTKVVPIKAAIAYPPVELFGTRHLEDWQVWILYVQVEYIRASLRDI